MGGIAFELLFAVAVIYLPPLQRVFGTAPLPWWALLLLLPMPVLVWGVDETYRAIRRNLTRATTTLNSTTRNSTTIAGSAE